MAVALAPQVAAIGEMQNHEGSGVVLVVDVLVVVVPVPHLVTARSQSACAS